MAWALGLKLSVIGPMELLDVAGLDVYEAVAGYLNGAGSVLVEQPAEAPATATNAAATDAGYVDIEIRTSGPMAYFRGTRS